MRQNPPVCEFRNGPGPIMIISRSALGSAVKTAWAESLCAPQLAAAICSPAVAALGIVMVAENAFFIGLAVPTLVPSKAMSTLLQLKFAPVTVTLAPGS